MIAAGELRTFITIEKGEIDTSTRDSSIKNYETEKGFWVASKVSDYDRKLENQQVQYFRAFNFTARYCEDLDGLDPRNRRIDLNGQKLTLHSITDPDLTKQLLKIKAYQAL